MQYIDLIVMINGFHIKSLNMWKTLSDYIVKACNGQYLHRLQRWQTFVWCLRLAIGEKIREDLLYRQVWAIEDEGHYNEISSNVFICQTINPGVVLNNLMHILTHGSLRHQGFWMSLSFLTVCRVIKKNKKENKFLHSSFRQLHQHDYFGNKQT